MLREMMSPNGGRRMTSTFHQSSKGRQTLEQVSGKEYAKMSPRPGLVDWGAAGVSTVAPTVAVGGSAASSRPVPNPYPYGYVNYPSMLRVGTMPCADGQQHMLYDSMDSFLARSYRGVPETVGTRSAQVHNSESASVAILESQVKSMEENLRSARIVASQKLAEASQACEYVRLVEYALQNVSQNLNKISGADVHAPQNPRKRPADAPTSLLAASRKKGRMTQSDRSTLASVPTSVGKRPPMDMKRLDMSLSYTVLRVANWGETPALFLRPADQPKARPGFFKPPKAYFSFRFVEGDHIKVLKIGYSSSRNRVCKDISVRRCTPSGAMVTMPRPLNQTTPNKQQELRLAHMSAAAAKIYKEMRAKVAGSDDRGSESPPRKLTLSERLAGIPAIKK